MDDERAELWDRATACDGLAVIDVPGDMDKYDLLSELFHQRTRRVARDEGILVSKVENKRYFGDSTVCYRCGETGHTSRACPVPFRRNCMYCDRHHPGEPCKYMLCDNCHNFGHRESQCREKRRRQVLCAKCPTQHHYAHECPRAWREYRLLGAGQRRPLVMSCAYCHATDHFIDDCKKKDRRFSIFTKDYLELLKKKR